MATHGISIKYDVRASGLSTEAVENTLRNNAIVMFALIDNVDVINFKLNAGGELKYTRGQIQQSFAKDLREYTRDVKSFDTLLDSFTLRLFAYPAKYAMTMSSTPGIRISAQYNGMADKVQYSTAYGKLLSWDSTNGKIFEYGQNVEVPFDMPVYWSPLDNGSQNGPDKISVQAAIPNKNVRLTEKQVNIRFDKSTYLYTVEASHDVVIAAGISEFEKESVIKR